MIGSYIKIFFQLILLVITIYYLIPLMCYQTVYFIAAGYFRAKEQTKYRQKLNSFNKEQK